MNSFLDKLRAPGYVQVQEEVEVLGFDPDHNHCGLACVRGKVDRTAHGFVVDSMIVAVIQPEQRRLRGLDQTHIMVETLHKYRVPTWNGRAFAFIESQQVYPREDEERHVTIAKANDLLRLAHVSGGFHLKMLTEGRNCHVMLPAEWKGQRPKEVMHQEVKEKYPRTPSFTYAWERTLGWTTSSRKLTELTEAKWGHAMDALCLALYGINQVAIGKA